MAFCVLYAAVVIPLSQATCLRQRMKAVPLWLILEKYMSCLYPQIENKHLKTTNT